MSHLTIPLPMEQLLLPFILCLVAWLCFFHNWQLFCLWLLQVLRFAIPKSKAIQTRKYTFALTVTLLRWIIEFIELLL